MNKLQISLTDQESEIFHYKAAMLGYDLTRYVKYQLSRLADTFLGEIQESRMSQKLEKEVVQSKTDYKAGKLKAVNSVNDFF
jgi:KaiC/GvpD/RAD55 family RecA-like ATPase